jgi:hypothetical protein
MNIIELEYSDEDLFLAEMTRITDLISEVVSSASSKIKSGNIRHDNWEELVECYEQLMERPLQETRNLFWLHIEHGDAWTVVGRSDRFHGITFNDRLEIGIKDDTLAVQIKLMLS